MLATAATIVAEHGRICWTRVVYHLALTGACAGVVAIEFGAGVARARILCCSADRRLLPGYTLSPASCSRVASDRKSAAGGPCITSLERRVAAAGVKQHQTGKGGPCKRCQWLSSHKVYNGKSCANCKGATTSRNLQESRVVQRETTANTCVSCAKPNLRLTRRSEEPEILRH